MSEDARVEDAMVIEEAAEELPSGDGEDELFEDEAEDSGDGDSSDEDDDSAQDEFEKDGFVVDEAEEGEDEEDGIKKRRKKKRKERNDDLEDEELDLLEEAGVLLKRQKPGRRRLQQAGDAAHVASNADEMQNELFLADDLQDELEDRDELSDEPEDSRRKPDSRGRHPKDSRRQNPSNNPQSRSNGRETRGDRARGSGAAASRDDFNEDKFISDEMDDFIVEEGDEAARRKRASKAAAATGLSARALEEAHDIFGDIDGLVKMYQESRGRTSTADDDEEEEEELEDGMDEMELEDLEDEEDEEAAPATAVVEGVPAAAAAPVKPKRDPEEIEARRKALEEKRAALEAKRKQDQEMRAARKEEKNKRNQFEKILKAIGPEAVAAMYLRPEDEKIKETDWPERLQVAQSLLASVKASNPEGGPGQGASSREGFSNVIDIESATDWVFEDLFGSSSISAAKDLVEAGMVEVDASSVPPSSQVQLPQEPGKAVWKMQDLMSSPHDHMALLSNHDLIQLNSFRAIRKPRKDETSKSLWRQTESTKVNLRDAIKQTLTLIYEKGEEVPLIGLYRKEMVGELLSMREEDVPALATLSDPVYPPGTVTPRGRRVRRFEALWATYGSSLRFQRAAGKKASLMSKLNEALALLPHAPRPSTPSEEEGGSQPSSQGQGWDEKVEADRKVLEDLKKRLDGATFNPPMAKGWVPTDQSMGDIEARLKLVIMSRQSLSSLSASQGAANGSQSQLASRQTIHKAPVQSAVITYRQGAEAGLQALASSVLLTPEQYAENLDDPESQPNEPLDPGGQLSPYEWFQKQLEEKSSLRDLISASAGTVCDEIKSHKKALEDHLVSLTMVPSTTTITQGVPSPRAPHPGPISSDLLTTAAFAAMNTISSENLSPSHRSIGAAALARRFKNFVAQQLAADPDVRAAARSLYLRRGHLTVCPTASGLTHPSLEPWGKYGIVKNLTKKTLLLFVDPTNGPRPAAFSSTIRDQYLRLKAAEREGLITINITCDIDLHDDIFKVYQSTNVSATAKAWNEFRAECLKTTLVDHLFPSLLKEFTQGASAAAKEAALSDFRNKMWSIITRPPLKLAGEAAGGDDGEGGEVDRPRIMSAVWGPGEKQPTVLVLLEEQGALVDILPCGQLSGRIPKSGRSFRDVFNDEKKSKDIRRIKDRLLQKGTPHAILVGVSTHGGVDTSQLHEDLTRVCEFIFDEHAREIRETLETSLIEVRYADERLAALWEGCKAAKEEFPDQPSHVRRAIALGRLALDPLSVLSQLCSPTGREILSFKATDLQDLLSPDDLLVAVEQVMVSAVSQIGADVNLAANVTWRKDLLQFVPGLGPRKARALLEAMLKAGGSVTSRNIMFRELPKRPLGKVVFRNCGGCLRVTNAGLPQLVNLDFHALDGTRIHPESYRLAVALCESATGEGDVEAAMESGSDKIERADLLEICRTKDLPLSSKLATLIDIRHELLSPAGELRSSGGALSDREVFLLQLGESEESMREGRFVEARVVFVGRDEVKCRLTNSPIEAVIRKANFTSHGNFGFDLRSHVKKDDILTGRIVALRFEESQRDGSKHHVLELTTKSSDLTDLKKYEEKYCFIHEPFFKFTIDLEPPSSTLGQGQSQGQGQGQGQSVPVTPGASSSSLTSALEASTPSSKPGKDKNTLVIQRPIKHPLFRNVNYAIAAMELQDANKSVGSCIIRPAPGSKGSITLSLSIKTYKPNGPHDSLGTIIHSLDVMEQNKKEGPAAHLHLVTPLQIDFASHGEETMLAFEDLDELHANFVDPLARNVELVTKHAKFMNKRRGEIDLRLIEDKARNPGSIPYAIGVETEKGRVMEGTTTVFDGVKFFISFAGGTSRAHHDYFNVSHKGFYFRRIKHPSIDSVLRAFKQNAMGDRLGNRGGTATPLGPAPPPPFLAPPTAMSKPSYPPPVYAATPGYPPPSHAPQNPPRPLPVTAYGGGTPIFPPPPPPSFPGPPPGWANIPAGPPPGWNGAMPPQQPAGFQGFHVQPHHGLPPPPPTYNPYVQPR